jgi:hypothetical protein
MVPASIAGDHEKVEAIRAAESAEGFDRDALPTRLRSRPVAGLPATRGACPKSAAQQGRTHGCLTPQVKILLAKESSKRDENDIL